MMLINLLGVLLIGLIIWWFWLFKEKELTMTDGEIQIVVKDGVYEPARIKIPKDQPVTLQFLRKDASPCAGTLLFPDLELSTELPVNSFSAIVLPGLKKGEYPFHCQMQMYKGCLIVE